METNELTIDQINQMQENKDSESYVIEVMDNEKFEKTIWYIWCWNKGSTHKGNYQLENIVVSSRWIGKNHDDQGNVVRGPYMILTTAINDCIKLNEK